ncbi:MAG TPA: hypothetical protein VMV65_02390 [Alphaproteobacteria bacterium]|nr:hypothetical protein [Alphaproteobacteria bacterium]
MNVQVQDRLMDPISPFPNPFGIDIAPENEAGTFSDGGYSSMGSNGLDTISRMLQQFQQNTQNMPPIGPMGFFDMLSSMFSQAGSAFQQLFGGGNPAYGNEQYYSTASGGSNGDPHISFNGNTWDDMQSEPDLLNSDSIHGGYQLSTQTTTPNASGVTYNQSATVTTHDGATAVTLDNNGDATITRNGIATNLSPGQTVQMGNETVTRNQDGSLQVTCSNENGGSITTTMRQNGKGVDVNVSAGNVDLGGVMARGSVGSVRPVMRRLDENPIDFV